MNRILLVMTTAALGLAMTVAAQQAAAPAPAPAPAAQTAPHAWGDKDHDGKCDVTGQPVGQGRMAMNAAGRQGMRGGMAMRGGRGMRGGMAMMGQAGRGNGMRGNMAGRGMRGRGQCRMTGQAAAPQPAPAAEKQ